MRKFNIILSILLIGASAQMAFAQKPKLAVVVNGKELNAGAYKQFSGQVVSLINAKYSAVDRSVEALKMLNKEQAYQRSGAVDDDQIKKLGKQFAVQYLCIISITKSISDYYLEAKLVDVETAEYTPAHNNSALKSSADLTAAAESIADQLLGISTSASGGEFTDSRDEKQYRTVKIGSLVWMAENLNYNANGSKCYSNDNFNCKKYGRLYNWNTAKNAACPSDWHLPSKAEWDDLINEASGEETAGKKLKAKSGWKAYEGKSGNGDDKLGFAALPGGIGLSVGFGFLNVGSNGYWWNASESNDSAYYRSMSYSSEGSAKWLKSDKMRLLSVRCVKD